MNLGFTITPERGWSNRGLYPQHMAEHRTLLMVQRKLKKVSTERKGAIFDTKNTVDPLSAVKLSMTSSHAS